jgi:heme/copper-type cytochrome/quinol oxidase subunit 2
MSRLTLPLAASLLGLFALCAAAVSRIDVPNRVFSDVASAQEEGATERSFAVVAKKYAFSPARIEVYEGDLVRIELKTEDIAHSFTIDAYRISKRVSPRRPVTFDFRADHVGTFPIYCNLQLEEGCRRMRGELIVKARR